MRGSRPRMTTASSGSLSPDIGFANQPRVVGDLSLQVSGERRAAGRDRIESLGEIIEQEALVSK